MQTQTGPSPICLGHSLAKCHPGTLYGWNCYYNYPFEDCSAKVNWFLQQKCGVTNPCYVDDGSTDYKDISCNNPVLCPRIKSHVYLDDIECEAPINWISAYELHYCNYIREDSKDNVCSGRGHCWEDDICDCHTTEAGKKGYIGEWCETRYCFGVESTEKSVCSGNGDCIDDSDPIVGKCACSEGWFGPACNITSCNGVMTNETVGGQGLEQITCNGQGVCYAPDTCFCGYHDNYGNLFPSYTYFGPECKKTYCDYISSEISDVCSGHGKCVKENVCECNSTEEAVYSGRNCEEYFCYNILSTDFGKVCGGGGDCVDINQCECIPGEYFGEKCDVTICHGYLSNDSKVCSGKGKCMSFGVCTCDDPNIFGNCSSHSCYGIFSENQDVCSGHGKCISYNNCSCTDPNFSGSQCSLTSCGGLPSDHPNVCWGNGTCANLDSCVCHTNRHGPKCQYFICDGIYDNDTTVCNNSLGTCIGPNHCSCNIYGWEAESYCTHFMCYGIGEQRATVCNDRKGVCKYIDNCECSSIGYFGKDCFEYVNPGVNVQYIYDYIFGKRLLYLPYEIDASLLSRNVGVDYECFDDNILKSVRVNGVENNTLWLGTKPKCQFVTSAVSPSRVYEIQIEMGSSAPLLNASNPFEIEFIFQTVPTEGSLYKVYSFTPLKNEKSLEYTPPIINNNDEPFVPDKDKDDPVGPNGEEKDEKVESNTGLIVGLSVGGGSAVIVLVILIFLCICLLLCCCVTLFCCCCLSGVWCRKKKKEKDFEKDIEFSTMNFE